MPAESIGVLLGQIRLVIAVQFKYWALWRKDPQLLEGCPIPTPPSHSWSRMTSTLSWMPCRSSSPWKSITFLFLAAFRVPTSASKMLAQRSSLNKTPNFTLNLPSASEIRDLNDCYSFGQTIKMTVVAISISVQFQNKMKQPNFLLQLKYQVISIEPTITDIHAYYVYVNSYHNCTCKITNGHTCRVYRGHPPQTWQCHPVSKKPWHTPAANGITLSLFVSCFRSGQNHKSTLDDCMIVVY